MQKKLHSLEADTSTSQKSNEQTVNVIDFLNPIGDEIAVKYLFENRALTEKPGDTFKMIDEQNGKVVMPGAIPDSAAHKLSRRIAVLRPGKILC